MSNELDTLRREADFRRDAIARDVELVTDRVDPTRIAGRQKAKAGRRLESVRHSVFGNTGGRQLPPQSDSDADTGVTDRASDALDSVKQATPDSVGEFTEGNPLAAGLIGLGVGLLAATLIPGTREERRVADKVQGHVDRAAGEVARSGQAAAENVQPAVTDAVQAVKGSAQDSAQNVSGDARDAAIDVADQAKSSAEQTT